MLRCSSVKVPIGDCFFRLPYVQDLARRRFREWTLWSDNLDPHIQIRNIDFSFETFLGAKF